MKKPKYNYITQDQLNTILAEFKTAGSALTFDEYFNWHAAEYLPPNSILSPAQRAFVANVLIIFNNI
jgi:hypothetical protein